MKSIRIFEGVTIAAGMLLALACVAGAVYFWRIGQPAGAALCLVTIVADGCLFADTCWRDA